MSSVLASLLFCVTLLPSYCDKCDKAIISTCCDSGEDFTLGLFHRFIFAFEMYIKFLMEPILSVLTL